jgi:hypothetical protein
VPTGDIMKATLEGHFAGEPVVMGLGFISNSGAADFMEDSSALELELFTALDLGAGSLGAFMAPLSVQFILEAVRIQDLSPGTAAGRVWGENITGGNTTDDAVSPSNAMCVTWRTGLKGLAYRGRTYLTGFAEDSQNAGYWIGEIQTWARAAFIDPLMNAFGPFGTGNYSLALIHTVSGETRLVPPTATPITQGDVNNTVRSLRRRAVGVRISRHHSTP